MYRRFLMHSVASCRVHVVRREQRMNGAQSDSLNQLALFRYLTEPQARPSNGPPSAKIAAGVTRRVTAAMGQLMAASGWPGRTARRSASGFTPASTERKVKRA